MFFKTSGWPDQVITFIVLLITVAYTTLFIMGLNGLWFSPDWTTDDAYQQLFPFIEVLQPGRFEDDITYRMMKGYLTPLHYQLGSLLTYLTGSPVMMGHWMMLIQIVLFIVFTFLLIKRIAGIAPALIGITWLLHSREVVQRLTTGLPRGWSAPVIVAVLYFAVNGSYRSTLIALALGCLLHPPSAMILALTYGIYLIWNVVVLATTTERRRLFIYVALSPLYILITYLSIKMPSEFGSMATLKEASQMPEFSNEGGRFPFVPLVPYLEEWWRFGFQAFLNKWSRPKGALAWIIPILVVVSLFAMIITQKLRGIKAIHPVILLFGLSAVLVHALSRYFAFYLYVPNRHLQIPMAVFFIVSFSSGIWLIFKSPKYKFLAYLALFVVVLIGSGSGLQGKANFNTHVYQKGKFAHWLRKNSPKDSLVAGYPTVVDAVPLFAERKVLISTELAHPFYRGYYDKIKDRITVSLKAHYSKNLEELYDLLAPLDVDYFVFQRSLFYPEALAEASFFKPYDQLVFQLTNGVPYQNFAYRQLPQNVDLVTAPYMPFKDKIAAVVDIKKLGVFLGRIK